MRALLLSAIAAAPLPALASGIDAPTIGSVFSGPVTRDAAALYHNPSLLVRLDRPAMLASLGLVAGSIGYTRNYRQDWQHSDSFEIRDPVDPVHLDPNKSGPQRTVSATPFSPTGDLFFALPMHDRLAIGFGVYVPYAAPVEFDADGPQRFALQEAFIAVSHLSGGLSVAFTDTLSVGAGVSYVFGMANLKRIEDFGSVPDFADALAGPPVRQANSFGADAPSTVRELDVLARPFSLTNAIAHAVSFNVGLFFEPTRQLDIGLTYDHGAKLDFEGDFALDMNDDFFTQDLAAQGLTYAPLIEGDAALGFRLPKRINAAVAYDVHSRLRLEGRVGYIMWSDIDAFDVSLRSPDLAQPEFGLPATSSKALVRDWNDSVHLEVHGGHGLSSGSTIRWMLGFQTPASPDETIDVSSPDGQRLVLGAGYEVGFDNGMRLIIDSKIQTIAPREVTTSRHDLGNGEYTLFLASVGAHLTVPLGADPAEDAR